MGKSVYIVKAYPSGIDRWKEFQEKGIIALGWPNLGDISDKTKDELKELLPIKGYCEGRIGKAASQIYCFSSKMKKLDFVIVPHNGVFTIGEIQDKYKYVAANVNDGYPHQHPVDWIAKIPFNFASDELLKRLTLPPTIIDISTFAYEIEELIKKFGLQKE